MMKNTALQQICLEKQNNQLIKVVFNFDVSNFMQKAKVCYARASSERHKIPTLLERIHTGGIEKVVVTQKVWLYYYYFTISCMFEFSFIYFDFHCFIIYYFLL